MAAFSILLVIAGDLGAENGASMRRPGPTVRGKGGGATRKALGSLACSRYGTNASCFLRMRQGYRLLIEAMYENQFFPGWRS